MRSNDRYGNHRNATFHRQVEWTLLERKQFAIERALSFYVDGHVQSLLDDCLGSTHGFDTGIAIAAIDGDERSHAHGAA